jgi:hypothetical protein
MDPSLVGGEGLFDNGCLFGEVVIWMEDVSMCNLMYIKSCFQIICTREIKCHLQNLQQFRSKFEIEKQGPWSEVKVKNILH